MGTPPLSMPPSTVPLLLNLPTLNMELLSFLESPMLSAMLLPLLLPMLAMLELDLPTLAMLELELPVTIIKFGEDKFHRHLAVSPKLELPSNCSCLETVLCPEGSFFLQF